MAISPNTNNLIIGKGNVYFTPVGGGKRHMGNCPKASIEVVIEKLEHFSSMEGVKTKDLTVIVQKSAKMSLVLEEFNYHNVAMAVLGTVSEGSDGIEIAMGAADSVTGEVEFVGTNAVGPKWRVVLLNVSFTPSSPFELISDEWGQIELEGDVAFTGATYGTTYTGEDASETETFTDTEVSEA